MTQEQLKLVLSTPLALFALMVIASMSNGIKQLTVIRQTGKPMSYLSYLSYWPETLGMVLANVIAFAILILTDQLNFASAIGIGYGANSIIDMLPGKRSLALKSTPDDPEKLAAKNLPPSD